MPDGTLVVVDNDPFGEGAVVRVHPVTGNRTLVSGHGRGDGPPLGFPTGIAVEADGALVVTDEASSFVYGGVVRVHPGTGKRTILFPPNDVGSIFDPLSDIAVEADGALVVTHDEVQFIGDTGAVVRVHSATGERTVFSGCDAIDPGSEECTSFIGDGPPLAFWGAGGIAVEPDGSLVVTDAGSGVVRVHPSTGKRTVLSGCAVRLSFPCPDPRGTGPTLAFLMGIAVEADGALVVTGNNGFGAVVRVHPATGDRVLVSGFDRRTNTSIGSGPLLLSPGGIAVEADGALVVADGLLRAVVRVDPLTGNRTILSRGRP
jgi:DNA-binding beta-propeller fold protein YncE